MAESLATIVVAPRERFSYASESLESIFKCTAPGVPLVYVDGGSPGYVKGHLEAEARRRGFELVRTEHYLSPNQARNLGLKRVKTKYVVFVDNDLEVTPGWLDSLVDCAEGTDASVVGPLYFIGKPENRIIHMAGGDAHVREVDGQRYFHEQHRLTRTPLAKVKDELRRTECELVEFHCMLVRMGVFEQIGPLDEAFLSSGEHIDLCLGVREQGGTVYFEPSSLVTYRTSPIFALSDLPYYRLRWGEEWNRISMERFRKKWRLSDRDPWIAEHYGWLTRHRRDADWRGTWPAHVPGSQPAGEFGSRAQTNIQLYNQLRAAGHRGSDLELIRRAYDMAVQTLEGRTHRSGKPLICHVVGVASILAMCSAAPPVLAAGLVHPVKAMDGEEAGSIFEELLPLIREALGKPVGLLVERYAELDWNAKTIPDIHRRLDEYSQLGAELLLIRLAKELDNHLDIGLVHARGLGGLSGTCRNLCLDLASRLGFPELRTALASAIQQTETAELALDLRERADQ